MSWPGSFISPTTLSLMCGVLNLPGLKRYPNLSPIVAATDQSHSASSNLDWIEECLVLDQGALLAISLRMTDPFQHHVVVVERTHIRYFHVLVGEYLVGLIELQLIEVSSGQTSRSSLYPKPDYAA